MVLRDLQLMAEPDYQSLLEKSDELGRMLTAFRQKVKSRIDSRRKP